MATTYFNPDTGHWYEAVLVSGGTTWQDAQTAATARGGYLATITSSNENDFVFSLINTAPYWTELSVNFDRLGPWLGGYSTVSGVWTWALTGEPIQYSAWYQGQPDSAGGQLQAMLYYAGAGMGSTWGDLPPGGVVGFPLPTAYIAEFNKHPVSGTDGPDTLDGTSLDDYLAGLGGNDLLWGGEGNDVLSGGTGDDELVVTPWDGGDELIGGDGVDFVSYQPSWWGVYVVLSQGAYGDSFVSIEGLTGSNFDDVLSAGTLPAKLYGGMGNDVLVGGPGEDLLDGGYGDDYLYVTAYDGADVIDGGSGYDILSYGGANTPLYIDLSFLYGDSVTGIEAVQGSKFDDTMVGTAGNDRIDGNEGNDLINAGSGDDVILMRNWDGADTVNGGEGADTVSYEITNTGISASLVAPTYGDTFTGIEHLTGSNYADTIIGDGSANRLAGLAGNDTLTGGAGADTFVFNAAPNALTNLDTILDFVSGTDRLEFSKSVFAGLSGSGTLSAEQFWSGAGATSAHDADDRVVYDTSTGSLYYDADGLGGVEAIQVALLGTTSHTGMVHGDIIVGH